MLKNLPFERRIFWKVLPTVYVLVVVGWVVAVRVFGYEMTSADYGGSFIASTLFSYLLHLWLLPPEAFGDDDDTDDGLADRSPPDEPT